MRGFFDSLKPQRQQRQRKRSSAVLTAASCESCGLYLTGCLSPLMEPYGEFRNGIMVIGEAPGAEEDARGKPWQGPAGRLLQRKYHEVGIDLFQDCVCLNAVNCRPPENRTPTSREVAACREVKVMQAIRCYKPKLIILHGNTAVESIIGRYQNNKKSQGISTWAGWAIPDRELGAWVFPTFHPSYLLRQGEEESEVDGIMFEHLARALSYLEKPLPPADEMEAVEIVPEGRVEEVLVSLLRERPKYLALDIEATGRKPYNRSSHQIVSISLCGRRDKAYAFRFPETGSRAFRMLKRLLEHQDVGKIAHNIKYEHSWLSTMHGIEVQPWVLDTMVAAHVLDNRQGITGLKFQAYVRFGISGYEEEMERYLRSQDSNSPNKILEAPTEQLLLYNGLDALLTYRLAMEQLDELRPYHYKNAYQLFHEGLLALSRAERQGIRIDIDYCRSKQEEVTRLIEELEAQLRQTKFYRRWKHVFGDTTNIYSSMQLSHMLYKVMKLSPPKFTESGRGAVDEDALKKLGMPELDLILRARKLAKIRDTYLESFVRETNEDGFMRPNFNLHLARTYRSSSSDPNFQNIPKRDKEAQGICRRAILPRPGHMLVEADFSALEVAVSCFYHKDPEMIRYVTDKKADMHGDMAKQIFFLPHLDKTIPEHARLRNAAKNGFVFPQFYGDYYVNCALNLCDWVGLPPEPKWDKSAGMALPEGITIAEHLINHGIRGIEDFIDHLQGIEEDFWGRRFRVYHQWRERWVRRYRERGFLRMLTGFVCSGPMRKNEIINYPIQGTAFHLLLKAFILLDQFIIEQGLQSRLVGQIHDSMILDVWPPELSTIREKIQKIVREELPSIWDWINVPLEIEIEEYGVDQPWVKL